MNVQKNDIKWTDQIFYVFILKKHEVHSNSYKN